MGVTGSGTYEDPFTYIDIPAISAYGTLNGKYILYGAPVRIYPVYEAEVNYEIADCDPGHGISVSYEGFLTGNITGTDKESVHFYLWEYTDSEEQFTDIFVRVRKAPVIERIDKTFNIGVSYDDSNGGHLFDLDNDDEQETILLGYTGSTTPPGMTLVLPSGNSDSVYLSGTPTTSGTYTATYHVQWATHDEVIFYDYITTVVTTPRPTYTHTIVYNGNNATGGSTTSTTVTDYVSGNSNVTFGTNGFTREGFTFSGWRVNNTGQIYQPNSTYPVSGNSSVTAYAQWTRDAPPVEDTYLGADGLTYIVQDNILTVSGTADNKTITSLSGGNLTTDDGELIILSDIGSATIGPNVVSAVSGAFQDIDLRIVTFRSAIVDNGNILDGNYSIATANGNIQAGTYTSVNNVWYVLDETPFMLVLDPNGGSYRHKTSSSDVITMPSAMVNDYKYRGANGKSETPSSGNPYSSYTSFIRYRDLSGQDLMVLPLLMSTSTELEVRVKDLPSTSQGGNGTLIPPPGFDNIKAWDVLTPYHEMIYKNGAPVYPQNSGYYTVKLSRATRDDNVCHAVARPFWIPSREDRLRALMAAPGLGSLDFGNIQSVSVDYNSSLTTIPIVCRGFTGTYCMDLGVTKSVTINYLRVSPDNPDNTDTDSRLWDNATWQKKLREFQDRWQLMTNGCSFYLKRPDNPRLANGDETDHDPMKDMIEEIDGENCYIQSAPISFPAGKPHSMQSSISFKMGTLYPKQEQINTVEIRFVWVKNGQVYDNREFYVRYPADKMATVPTVPATWTPFEETIGGDTKYFYASNWYSESNIGSRNKFYPSTTFSPSAVPTPSGYGGPTLFADVNSVGLESVKLIKGGDDGKFERSYNISVTAPGINVATLRAWCLGAGGGGGGGSSLIIPSQEGGNLWMRSRAAGGGGGGSGVWRYGNKAFSTSMSVRCVLGQGGDGGTSNGSSGQANYGYDGTNTSIYIGGSSSPFISAEGGFGGIGAHDYSSPGGKTDERTSDRWGHQSITWISGMYSGGMGGGVGSNWQNPGQKGDCPSNISNEGSGGAVYNLLDIINYREVHSGGGGGGGGADISSMTGLTTTNAKGGDGVCTNPNFDTNKKNGGYGCGGGGAAYIYGQSTEHSVGGQGGHGAIYLIVEGGEISEVS